MVQAGCRWAGTHHLLPLLQPQEKAWGIGEPLGPRCTHMSSPTEWGPSWTTTISTDDAGPCVNAAANPIFILEALSIEPAKIVNEFLRQRHFPTASRRLSDRRFSDVPVGNTFNARPALVRHRADFLAVRVLSHIGKQTAQMSKRQRQSSPVDACCRPVYRGEVNRDHPRTPSSYRHGAFSAL
jgi:hypothetical protein